MKGGGGQLEQTQTVLRDEASMRQRHDSLHSLLRSRAEKISADSEQLAEWDLQRDSLARWITSEARRLVSCCCFCVVELVVGL